VFDVKTFLQEVLCVRSGFNTCRLAQNYSNTIQTPNTFENRNVIRHNLRIFKDCFQPKIFSFCRKIQYSYKNKECSSKSYSYVLLGQIRFWSGYVTNKVLRRQLLPVDFTKIKLSPIKCVRFGSS